MFGNMHWARMTALALLALVPSLAAAQSTSGERVRVTYDAGRSGVARVFRGSTSQVVGRVVSHDSTALVVDAKGNRRVLPAASIRRVEVSTGHKRRVGKYALLGAGSTALSVTTLYFLLAAPLGAELDSHNRGISLAIVGGGAVVGALIGAAFPEEQWRRVRKR